MLKQIAKAVTISSGNTCNVKSRKSLKGEKDFLGLWRALTDGAKFRLQVTEKPGVFRFLFRSSSGYPCLLVCDSLLGIVLGEKNDPNLRGDIYEESELGFVNLLIGKMQADLRRDFPSFSDLDISHSPNYGCYPIQFRILKR